MPYTAQITRTNPGCVLLLIDESGSMAEPYSGGADQSKAQAVADAVNRVLQNLVLRCAKADQVRDYFHVGLLGYGKGLRAGLGGKLPDDLLVPIGRFGARPGRVEDRTKVVPDGAGGFVELAVRFPVWFEPAALGRTPMCAALERAERVVRRFAERHPQSFPPIVLNLTDGKPSDGNPLEHAKAVGRVTTGDGPALLFNLLLSTEPTPAVFYPADERPLPDTWSKLLFRMSSPLPPKLWEAARAEGFPVEKGARGVVLNADPTAVIRFLDIGTRIMPGAWL